MPENRLPSVRKTRQTPNILIAFVLALFCLLSGCTNSKFVIGTLYDRLDDQIRGEFNKLGKFNDQQKSDFEVRLQTFHYWHRRQELPIYADLLRSVASVVQTKNATSKEDVKSWFAAIEKHADAGQACYPVHYSFDLIKQLRNDQVDFIERRFNSERNKNRQKYNSKTREERREMRLDNITKWSSRVGFDWTNRQKRMLMETMAATTSLHKKYYQVSERWNRRTFEVVRMRHKPGFDVEMRAQLDRMFRLVETHYPTELAENRQLWRQFAFDFANSMTNNQRVWAKAWLNKLAKNLDKIARKDVKFTPHTDPSLGCLVQAES